ncbi:stealth conserved region 3 domain-containing protein [Roseicella aerolata]|uniref:Stealth family protein n=1 Tax=Roseicella aerolata TaxID=2883479 RepID=A0A9X1IC19_9PROT|nr:stealth conserved region 3 domain-containing protein [Roseicella aerolata]MCB4822051.1 stealth family protein [Roseicella aerolata]
MRPVDVVFTWVDGSTAKFRENFTRFAVGAQDMARLPQRFSDNGELRYAVRSVKRNMPWVRDVIVVHNGEPPSLGGVRLVSHSDIFPDSGHLPTFSSTAIECHLHRIPSLSEDFIYFNDDFFVCRPVSPEDLQGQHGLGRVILDNGLMNSPPNREWELFRWLLWVTNAALDARFGPAKRNAPAHTPQWYNRTLCSIVENEWERPLRQTSAHRFRTRGDLWFRALYCYYVVYMRHGLMDSDALCEKAGNDFHKANDKDAVTILFGDKDANFRAQVRQVLEVPPMFLCLNDHISHSDPNEGAKLQMEMVDFLNRMFPN